MAKVKVKDKVRDAAHFSAIIAERSATTKETVQLRLTMRVVEVVRHNQRILEQLKTQLHISGRRTYSS